jgi:hypothetical protein
MFLELQYRDVLLCFHARRASVVGLGNVRELKSKIRPWVKAHDVQVNRLDRSAFGHGILGRVLFDMADGWWAAVLHSGLNPNLFFLNLEKLLTT